MARGAACVISHELLYAFTCPDSVPPRAHSIAPSFQPRNRGIQVLDAICFADNKTRIIQSSEKYVVNVYAYLESCINCSHFFSRRETLLSSYPSFHTDTSKSLSIPPSPFLAIFHKFKSANSLLWKRSRLAITLGLCPPLSVATQNTSLSVRNQDGALHGALVPTPPLPFPLPGAPRDALPCSAEGTVGWCPGLWGPRKPSL